MIPEILRWEWRTFGTTFGDAEARIHARPAQIQQSRETYVVCSESDTNAKVRNLHFDVKVLQEVNRDGLERWLPAFKAPFPLDRRSLEMLFGAWGLPLPRLRLESYSLDTFLSELVAPHLSLTAVHVGKQRQSFTIDDCIVEIAELNFDGAPLRTIAVEMPDPARVMDTVRKLGLARYENVNYVKALKRFLATRVYGA